MKIHIVEDDENIREIVSYTLNSAGFAAEAFEESESFFAALKKEKPDLIILDIMLPGRDGMMILSLLRAGNVTRDIPVIMLTAKSGEFDKVKGLDAGADDYITKPFGTLELISRVKALLRRTGKDKIGKDILQYAGLTMELPKRKVSVDGRSILLTQKEYDILALFIANPGMVFTREQLLEQVWGYIFEGETRTVDMHIRTLRQKLGGYGDNIETLRGIGYRIKEE